MNGPHDLGGQMGLGPVVRESEDIRFHAEWEQRVLAMVLAAAAPGGWNIDQSRHARENRHPVDYLSSSYYEIWIKGLERLLLERGLLTEAELAEGRSAAPGDPGKRVLTADEVPATLRRGGPAQRPAHTAAAYAVGQQVRTKNLNPTGHTRLPRYARDKSGVIERIHGTHVFADSNALGDGEQPQWLYTVSFNGGELWGEGYDDSLVVSIDAWESYLVPA